MSELTQLMTTAEAAICLSVKPQTLAKWRSQGTGPYFVRIGGKVFYRQSELNDYINEGVTAPEKK